MNQFSLSCASHGVSKLAALARALITLSSPEQPEHGQAAQPKPECPETVSIGSAVGDFALDPSSQHESKHLLPNA